jgi:hypothetical protein
LARLTGEAEDAGTFSMYSFKYATFLQPPRVAQSFRGGSLFIGRVDTDDCGVRIFSAAMNVSVPGLQPVERKRDGVPRQEEGMMEEEWHLRVEARLAAIDGRLNALEAHAAAAAEVLAHAERLLAEWQEFTPVLREIRLGERRGRG